MSERYEIVRLDELDLIEVGDNGLQRRSAIALMLRDDKTNPDQPALLYNLACIEARAGRADDALQHLARAIELSPRFAEFAREDEDFESLRADPRFTEALSRPSA